MGIPSCITHSPPTPSELTDEISIESNPRNLRSSIPPKNQDSPNSHNQLPHNHPRDPPTPGAHPRTGSAPSEARGREPRRARKEGSAQLSSLPLFRRARASQSPLYGTGMARAPRLSSLSSAAERSSRGVTRARRSVTLPRLTPHRRTLFSRARIMYTHPLGS